jgi:hypothetical protein
LAGLNISLIYKIYTTNKNNGSSNGNKNKNKHKISRLLSLVGIIPGLFVSCPICAGNMLLLSIVGTSFISAGITITFTHYQAIFLIFGVILMIIFPFIASRNKILFIKN